MQIFDIGTFLLPLRFSLPELMSGGVHQLAEALSAEFSEFGALEQMDETEVLLDFHRSTGAQSMETMVFQGTVSIEGLGRVHLCVSSLSVGFAVVSFEVPDEITIDLESTGDRRTFKGYERPVSEKVAALIETWSLRVAAVTPERLKRARPTVALPANTLLWWHRVAVDPPEGKEFPAARFYGVEIDLAQGVRATVGNGFTNIHGSGAHEVADEVIEGLMVATQQWLIVDEAKRLLADHLIRLSQSRGHGLISVDAQYNEVLELTEEVTLRNLHLAEEVRYLANARSKVRDAASLAWRMDKEADELEQRTSALSSLFALHRDRIFNDRDDRRNRLVFVFTAVTLIQSVLVWYDFLTGSGTSVGGRPRPAIAITVLVLTVVSVAGAICFRFVTGWLRRLAVRRFEAATSIAAPTIALPTRVKDDEADLVTARGRYP